MKKLLTSLLCVMMIVCFMPSMAWADSDAAEETGTVVAKIGDAQFTSLQAAINSVTDSSEDTVINLTANIEVSEQIKVNKAVTIDGGNQYTIKAVVPEGGSWSPENGSKNLMLIEASASIKNLVLDSDGKAMGVQAYCSTQDGRPDVAFENVTMQNSKGTGLQANGANVTVTGVTIENSGWNQSFEVSNGSGVAGGAKVTVNEGCHFNDPLKIVSDQANGTGATVTFAEGVTNATATKNMFPGKNAMYTNTPEAKIGGNYYYSLADAISAAEANDIVVLADNVTLLTPLTIDKKVTINGNGKTITAENLPVEDTTGFGNFAPITLGNNADVTFAGETTFKGFDFTGKPLVSFNNAGTAKMTIAEDAKVTFTENKVTTVLSSGTHANNEVIVNGTLDVSSNDADGMNGGTLTVNDGGKVVADSNKRHGITAKVISSGNGTITATNNGYNGLTLNGGTDIKGSTVVTAKNNNNRTTNEEPLKNSNGETVPCSDIAINTMTTDASLKSVDIGGNASVTAGTMNGYYHSSNSNVTGRDKVVNVNGSGVVVTIENPSNGENENDTNKLFVQNAAGDSVEAMENTRTNGVVILGNEGTVYGTVTGTIDLPAGITVTVPSGSDAFGATFDAPAGTTVKNESSKDTKVSTPNGTYTVKANGGKIESKPYNPPYVPTTPTTQKPVIEPNADVTTSLSSDGTTLTIKANDGYEITDVTVNGVSKGAVDKLTGLKTGDKVVIKTQKVEKPDDNAALIEAVKSFKLVARSANAKAPSGKKAIKVTWFAKDGSELNFDGYEIYRSTKKNSGYGTMPIYKTTKSLQYFNTSAKKGTRYYYKVRGYKMIGGEKVYTQYSLKAIRTAK